MSIRAIAWGAFIIFGSWAAWKDLRERRVANRWILVGLGTCALLYAALGLGVGWQGFGAPDRFFAKAALVILIGGSAAVALWRFGVWPAGDAKLFIVFCLLLTLMDPNLRGFPLYLWLIALVNIFVMAALGVLGLMAIEWTVLIARLPTEDGWRDARGFADRVRKRLREEWPRRGRWAVLVWNTFALFILCRLFLGGWRRTPEGWESLALFAAFYLGWAWVCRLLANTQAAKLSFLAFSLFAVPAGVFWKRQILWELWAGSRQAIGFLFFLPFARMFIDFYLDRTRRFRVAPADMRSGLILSQESWQTLMPVVAGAAQEPWVRYADGLSMSEASWLKENAAQAGTELQAHQAIPFAPWVFLGMLWTALSRKNVVECLMRLL